MKNWLLKLSLDAERTFCTTRGLAKWYDVLWLLVPIVGICFFVAAIEDRRLLK